MNNFTRNETKRKHADVLISLGEKFFYAAYITPIVILIKFGFTQSSSIIAVVVLGSFTGLGLLFLEKGLYKYDKLKD